jgi:hypothetical protein
MKTSVAGLRSELPSQNAIAPPAEALRAQTHHNGCRTAGAHHAGHREHAAGCDAAEAAAAQHARDPLHRHERLDAEPSSRPSTIACQMALP